MGGRGAGWRVRPFSLSGKCTQRDNPYGQVTQAELLSVRFEPSWIIIATSASF
jgi:hypothetical protein